MLRDRVHAAIEAVLCGDMPIGVLCDMAEELGIDPAVVANHRGDKMDGWCPLCSGRMRYAMDCLLVVLLLESVRDRD